MIYYRETIILQIISHEASEAVQKKRLDLLAALDCVLSGFYYFTQGHFSESMQGVSFTDYLNTFYAFIMEERPVLPLTYRKGITRFYANRAVNCSADKAIPTELRRQISAHRVKMTSLEASTADIRRILDHQPILPAMSRLRPLLNWFKANPERQMFIYENIFNYGYIEGKRAERRRSAARKDGAA